VTAAGGSGSAHTAMVSVVDHDVPSDPVARLAERRAQAQREVDGCRAKVAKAEAHLAAATTPEKQERQLAHLVAAELALASAEAEQKGLD
jgi:multidrug resistance efflux pump